MVSKNNKQEQLRRSATKKTRFSLKKLSVGVASVAVGATLLIGNVAHAQEETVTSEGSKETEDQITDENKSKSVEGDNADNGVLEGTPVSDSSSIDTPVENQEAPEGAVNVSDADKQTFEAKREELRELFKKRDAAYRVLEEVNGKKVTNRLQQAKLTELANKIEKVYAELNELAKTSEQKVFVEGLKNAIIDQYLTVPPLKESEQSSEFELAKRQAKAFITGLSSDLSAEQRKKYYDAIDKVDANDPDYVQRMEEIYQVAAAEKLTRSVEKGNTQHKILAEEALKKASAGTRGGSLIDGKDKLVYELEKQLEEAEKANDPFDTGLHKAIVESELGTNPNNSTSEAVETEEATADDFKDEFARVEKENENYSPILKRAIAAAKRNAYDVIGKLNNLSEEEKARYYARVENNHGIDAIATIESIVEEAKKANDPFDTGLHKAIVESELGTNPNNSTSEAVETEEATADDFKDEFEGHELDAAKAEALAQIAELEYFTAKEKEALVDRINEYDNLGDVDFIVTKAIEQNDDRHQAHRALLEGKLQGEDEALPPAGKPGPDAGAEDLGVVDPEEEEAGRELDTAKAEALAQIAELEYFTAKEKEALVNRINEYDNLGDVDFIVTKAIEQNDDRHQAHRALLEGKLQGEDETLPEIGKPNDTDKDNYAKDFALAAYKEQVIDELKSKGFNNDFVFSAIRRANTVKGIDSLIAELDLPEGQPEIEDAFKTYKEAKIAELEAKGFEGNSLLGKLRNAKTREGFDNLLALLEAQLKDNVQPPVVDKPEFEGGVNHYEGLVNRKPEFPFDQLLKLYKEKVIEDLKEQDFHNDFVFDQIERAKTIEGINSLIENLDVKNALLNKAKAGAAEDIRELTAFSKEEKEELIAKVFSYDNVGDIDFIVTKAQQLNDERLKDHDKAIEDQIEGEDETLPETGKPNDTDADDIFGSKLDKAKAGALEDIAGLDYFTADEKAKLEDLVNEVESLDEFVEKVDKAISEAIEENDKRHKEAGSSIEDQVEGEDETLPETGKPNDTDADDIFGSKLDKAKAGALEDIAGLDYFTADEKAKLEDLVNEVESLDEFVEKVDKAISEAIEENDKRHKAAQSSEEKPGDKEEQKPGKEEQKPGKEEQKPGKKEQKPGKEEKPGQKESDKGQLQSAKDNAKGEIDKLPNLSDKQKGDLKAGLDKADSLAKVQEILDFARKLNKDQAPKQEDKKEEKKGQRLPDTATGAWALGLVGVSSLLAGAGVKKFKK